jgi:hypothetical protein
MWKEIAWKNNICPGKNNNFWISVTFSDVRRADNLAHSLAAGGGRHFDFYGSGLKWSLLSSSSCDWYQDFLVYSHFLSHPSPLSTGKAVMLSNHIQEVLNLSISEDTAYSMWGSSWFFQLSSQDNALIIAWPLLFRISCHPTSRLCVVQLVTAS